MRAGLNLSRVAFCCGALEAGEFQTVPFEAFAAEDDDDWEYGTPDYTSDEAKDTITAWKGALSSALEECVGCSIQFWFVRKLKDSKGNYEESFDNQDLMDIVKAIPGAKCIAEEYINRNSSNKIEGWVIFNDGNLKIT